MGGINFFVMFRQRIAFIVISVICSLFSGSTLAISDVLKEDCRSLSVHIAEVSMNLLRDDYFEVSLNEDGELENLLELDEKFQGLLASMMKRYDYLCSRSSLLKTTEGKSLFEVSFRDNDVDILWELTQPSLTSSVPIEEFKIHREDLEIKKSYTYCLRDIQVIDKITIHHTLTAAYLGAKEVNQIHLDRGFATVGYHYILRSNYKYKPHRIRPRAYYGRSESWVGGHNKARLNSYNPLFVDREDVRIHDILTESQNWNDASRYLKCFSKKGSREDEISVEEYFKSSKSLTENIRSLGIGISGTYYDGHEMNLESVNSLSRLICEIRKRYPNIKYIDSHQDTRQTHCPGHIRHQLDVVRNKIDEYCPDHGIEFIYL